jgi:hypothetical protein
MLSDWKLHRELSDWKLHRDGQQIQLIVVQEDFTT